MLLAAVGSGRISPSVASRTGCCTALTDGGPSSGQGEYSTGKSGGTQAVPGAPTREVTSVQIHLLSLGY